MAHLLQKARSSINISTSHPHRTHQSSHISRRRECWLSAYATIRHPEDMGVHGETAIDKPNECGHDITDVNRLPMVALGDVKDRRRHDLLPTKAHVCTENSDSG